MAKAHNPRSWRVETAGAHIGLACTAVILAVVFHFGGLRRALLVFGGFLVWFLLALTVILIRGRRGGDALRRAYVATFGWGDYVTP
ncbi:hypothetical protein [Streptomyces acidiscabies]|uniref:Uncharacterized protein n=1 Tax=Streptomyces acidiscabies TaxID=42234 RepID=A0AAP6EI29_9ACTN|nr:hypothetical protein [Streptomyces acidiscabies]MBP5939618.1 hypothetical protein [Streptomyces sp. LBUM 1476]MBZ3910783.1 hypothetical protein [Streptomyces acidiscabies]MDX2963035.1 hypothetical protein [Streptomyces acidiscabies]MDX3017419.1 hypothetical protein [Streptomyces acidiscabies]MDX3787895.1 hypothetical protein [Streptomyces acidiscabies]